MDGAYHRRCEGHSFIRNNAGNTEIHNFRDHGFCQHNVLWFYITMNNIVIMGVLQSGSQLRRQSHRQSRVHFPVLFLKSLQRNPFYILHHNITHIILNASIKDIDNRRMNQTGSRTGLALKLFGLMLIIHQILSQYFNGDFAVQPDILSQIDFRHAA